MQLKKREVILRPLLLCGVVSWLMICAASFADGLVVVSDPPRHPPTEEHAFAPLEVKRHHVDVEIKSQVATTNVDQVFHNPSNQELEGTYLFPLPEGAQIDKFTMNIGGEQVKAELLDAEKAQNVYERIVRRQKDPALLEYVGRGAFKVRIYPIEPKSDKRVRLQYTQLLEPDGGLVNYTYPLNTEKFSAKPIDSLSVRCRIKAKHALKSVYSPSHRVEVNHKSSKHAVVGYENSDVKPDSDFRLLYSAPQAPEHGISMNLLTYRDDRDKPGYYMLFASPGNDLTSTPIAAKDVVFVIDTSGSMRGKKISQVHRATRFCVKHLNKEDRFEIVRFSTEAEPLFEGLAKANEQNCDKALEFVKNLEGVGGTAIHGALNEAVGTIRSEQEKNSRPKMIVFLTDGRPTIGENNEDAIVKAVGEAAGARLFSFGVGTDINTHLLNRISENTGAFTQYVLPDEKIDRKLTTFYRRIAHPVLTDLDLQAQGDIRLHRSSPKNLGNLFRGQQLIQLGRYRGSGDAAVTLTGKVEGKTVELVRERRFPKHAEKHEFVPRLWATRRVGYLLDQIRLHGESEELRKEVTRLARRFGIVTPYTSYLILEDERRRDVPEMSRTIEGQARDHAHSDAELEVRVEKSQAHYQAMKEKKGGDVAVRSARSAQEMKKADNLSASAEAGETSGVADALAGGRTAASSTGKAAPSKDRKFVGGRAFYRRGDEWLGTKVQNHPDAERVELTFGSDRYFALLHKHPQASKWLSVGKRVQVFIDGKVYEVK